MLNAVSPDTKISLTSLLYKSLIVRLIKLPSSLIRIGAVDYTVFSLIVLGIRTQYLPAKDIYVVKAAPLFPLSSLAT